ncbi:unnamed protein product, partial [Effrenium voratum]
RDVVTATAQLSALAAQWSHALALLFSSKELQSEALSFRACLKACMAANQEDVTLRLLRHGPAPTLSKRDVEALVLQAPSCSLALELLSRRCSAKACSLLLQRWHRQREIAMSAPIPICDISWFLALAVLEKLWHFGAQADATLGADVAKGIFTARWAFGIQILETLQAKSVRMDVKNSNSIADSGMAAGCWAFSLDFLASMPTRSQPMSVASFSTVAAGHFAGGGNGAWPSVCLGLRNLRLAGLELDMVGLNGVLGKLGSWQRASSLLFLSEASGHQLENRSFSAVMAFASWQQVLALLWWMLARRLPPDRVCCDVAIGSCAAHKVDKALQLLQSLPRHSLQASCRAALSCCAKAARWADALLLLGPEADAVSYGTSIACCEKAQRWEIAMLLLNRRKHFDSPVLNSCISACRRGKQWNSALSLVARLESSGVQADDVTLGATVSCCEKALQWRWALNAFGSLRDDSVRPDVGYNAAVTALQVAAAWNQALRASDAMGQESVENDVLTYVAVVGSCRSWWQALSALPLAEGPSGALAAAWEPILAGCERSRAPVVPALLEELEALEMRFWTERRKKTCQVRVVQGDASEFFHGRAEMPGAQDKDSLAQLTSRLARLARSASWRRALDAADAARAARGRALDGPAETARLAALRARWTACSALLQRLFRDGPQLDAAMLNVFMSAAPWRSALGALQTFAARSVALTSRSALAACRARWAQGLQWLKPLHARQVEVNVVVLNVAIAAGAPLGEFATWQLEPDLISFNSAADCLAKSGKWQEARHSLQQMEELGLERDLVSLNIQLSASAWRASFAWLKIRGRGLQPDLISFSALVTACERAGSWGPALEIFRQMPRRALEVDTSCCNAAVSACCKGQSWTWGVQLFSEMFRWHFAPVDIAGTAVLACCRRVEEWRSCLALLGSLAESDAADAAAFTCAMLACAKASTQAARRAAEGLLQEMRTLRLEVKGSALNLDIALQQARGRWWGALHVVGAFRVARLRLDVQSALGAVEGTPWARALEVLVSLEHWRLKPDVAVACGMLGALQAAAKPRQGLPLLAQADRPVTNLGLRGFGCHGSIFAELCFKTSGLVGQLARVAGPSFTRLRETPALFQAAPWGQSSMEYFLRLGHVYGTWPPNSVVPETLAGVRKAQAWLYSNLQVLLSPPGDRKVKMFEAPDQYESFSAQLRYGVRVCDAADAASGERRAVERHLRRLVARYRGQLKELLSNARLNQSVQGFGGEILLAAAEHLRRALPSTASGVDGECRGAAKALKAKAEAFHRDTLEGFFQLYAGAVCGSWAHQLPAAVMYHHSSALKLPGYHRGYILGHLLSSLAPARRADAGFGEKPCLRAVEIGVFEGVTSEQVLQQLPCLHLLSVDLAPRLNAWSRLRSFGNRSRLWRMSSAAAAGRFSAENENEAEALDFAFIDADHSYAAAKEDIQLWSPKVRPGGIVAGHDYSALWPGVVEAVHEFVARERLTLHLGADHMWWVHWPR